MAIRDETMTTSATQEEAVRAGHDTLQSLGLNVTEQAPDTLLATGGSKFMTYWLGLWLPSSNLPVKVTYHVTDNGTTRTIAIHTKSSFLFSLYVWKFRERANQVTDGLLQGLSTRLPQAPASAG